MVERIAQLALDGVEAREHQHNAHLQNLIITQRSIFITRCHEIADEVNLGVAQRRPPIRDDTDEVLGHRAHRRHCPGLALRIGEGVEDRVHPLDEQRVIGLRQTHDRQKRPGRVHRREVGHELAATGVEKGVDGPVAQFAHPGRRPGDRTG